MRLRLAILVTAAAFAAAVTVAPPAGAATVSLLVDSSTAPAPLFDGTVETLPHEVDGGDGSGKHPCWGPPGAPPAPSATGALDDAMRAAGIPWRGNWDPSFHDFFVDRIGPYASAPPDGYWSLTVNGGFSAGGCLSTVADGDAIRFHYGSLVGTGPAGGGGAPAGLPPKGGPAAGGGNDAPPRHRTSRQIGHLAAAATAYLRRSNGGIGREWAQLALALRAGRKPAGLARALSERLRALPGGGAVGRDVDSTALAAWALAVRGRSARARSLAVFVRAAQSPDGGFPTVAGGVSNAQSTGVALVALRVTGLGPRPSVAPGGPTPLDYLAALARRDGSIPYDADTSPTPVWSTAQALLGLTSKSKLLALDAGTAAG